MEGYSLLFLELRAQKKLSGEMHLNWGLEKSRMWSGNRLCLCVWVEAMWWENCDEHSLFPKIKLKLW